MIIFRKICWPLVVVIVFAAGWSLGGFGQYRLPDVQSAADELSALIERSDSVFLVVDRTLDRLQVRSKFLGEINVNIVSATRQFRRVNAPLSQPAHPPLTANAAVDQASPPRTAPQSDVAM